MQLNFQVGLHDSLCAELFLSTCWSMWRWCLKRVPFFRLWDEAQLNVTVACHCGQVWLSSPQRGCCFTHFMILRHPSPGSDYNQWSHTDLCTLTVTLFGQTDLLGDEIWVIFSGNGYWVNSGPSSRVLIQLRWWIFCLADKLWPIDLSSSLQVFGMNQDTLPCWNARICSVNIYPYHVCLRAVFLSLSEQIRTFIMDYAL